MNSSSVVDVEGAGGGRQRGDRDKYEPLKGTGQYLYGLGVTRISKATYQ